MVEVFKTNVRKRVDANRLVDQIHKSFATYKANFDLHDCDKILRVQCTSGEVHSSGLIEFLRSFGFDAEALPDEGDLLIQQN
jgi:hypothetical protein